MAKVTPALEIAYKKAASRLPVHEKFEFVFQLDIQKNAIVTLLTITIHQ